MFILLLSLLQMNLSLSNANPVQGGALECLDKRGKALPIINEQVIRWKTTTPSQYLARARVDGVVSDIYPDKNGHDHFAIVLDQDPTHNVELVYNQSFGSLPKIRVGMKVEACGDYITSNQPTSQYPASPAGAIIHWIHKNPSGQGHKSGYLMIDGTLYGQGSGQRHLEE